ncbi:MAG: hypothetical protein R3C18_12070 [Planctomycetaceae bacterium]
MNSMPKFPQFKLVHWLLIIAIVVVLVALLIPQAKWALSGEITIPVTVTVFDAGTNKPIQGARVAIIRGPWAAISSELDDPMGRIAGGVEYLDEDGVATDTQGLDVIAATFSTGANHEHPVTRAHTNFYWVLVTADGYGGVAVPVRYQSIESHVLRERGDLAVSIGLIRSDPVNSPTGSGQ